MIKPEASENTVPSTYHGGTGAMGVTRSLASRILTHATPPWSPRRDAGTASAWLMGAVILQLEVGAQAELKFSLNAFRLQKSRIELESPLGLLSVAGYRRVEFWC